MATELTTPVVMHHGDHDQHGRLLGDHHTHPHDHHGAHGQHTHLPVASVPVVVGTVPVVQAYEVVQPVVKPKPNPLRPIMALLLLALAATLIGLLAYQAHTFFGTALVGHDDNTTDTGFFGGSWRDDRDDDWRFGKGQDTGEDNEENDQNFDGSSGGQNSETGGANSGTVAAAGVVPMGTRNINANNANRNNANNNNARTNHANNHDEEQQDNVGFNGAGAGMWFFGILFAVLQAVTAIAMWTHLSYHMPFLEHSSIMGPLKVTAAVGFIAMGFACRHISLGARHDTSETHHRITHAIEAFIIINWFFVMLALIVSLFKQSHHGKPLWDCENAEQHRITRRMTAAWTQFILALILIGLLAAYFQLYTERWVNITAATEMLVTFAIMFAVLQAMSGVAMIQQYGNGAPGQMPETVHALLKVVLAFGIIAFGFACRSIYLTSHSYPGASPHLVAIQAFVIINFIVCVVLTYASSHGTLKWDNFNTTKNDRAPGWIFGILHVVFSIVLFGLLAGVLQGLTANEREFTDSINSAGKYMIWFGLLFAVIEFFAGCTMLEQSSQKIGGLNPASISVTSKVALALGFLAFGFACRHINIHRRSAHEGPRDPLVHAVESFIILNVMLTWLIDWLIVKGKIEWYNMHEPRNAHNAHNAHAGH